MSAALRKDQPQKSPAIAGSLLGDELLDEIRHLNDVIALRRSCRKQRRRLDLLPPDLSALPNPGHVAEWADQPRVAPRVNRQHLRTDGRSDVHRPAIHADDKVGCAEKPNPFSESGLVEQIYGVAGQFPLQLSYTCQNGCERPYTLAKLDHMFGRERLPFASRKRMQNDKGLVAKRRIHGKARRKWKNRPMALRQPE